MNRKMIALLMAGSLLTGAGGTYAGMQLFNKNHQISLPAQGRQSTDEKTQSEIKDLDKVWQAYHRRQVGS